MLRDVLRLFLSPPCDTREVDHHNPDPETGEFRFDGDGDPLLHRVPISLPRRRAEQPSKVLLEERYERFRAVS